MASAYTPPQSASLGLRWRKNTVHLALLQLLEVERSSVRVCVYYDDVDVPRLLQWVREGIEMLALRAEIGPQTCCCYPD